MCSNAENVKDDLNGLDKAVSAVLGQRTIERNQLLVAIAKSKFTKQRDDKGDKVTKPEELVRLYDLLIQNTSDLSDLVSSGRDRNPEEVTLVEESGKRAEAYLLFCHAHSLADTALEKLQMTSNPDQVLLEMLDVYESAVGDHNSKVVPRIERFPPPFQAAPCNPIVLDIAYSSIEFPSLENRMKKDKKGIFSRLWR
ncbi:hypothetical protein B296_00016790 [Ensete ventricosum]|uniref:Uncharacterized protein n=1 Tax=Ensete ventricosum TaxID=4639 RepID=A0A427B4V7_ENSVE|nr:hypothetical protein B296_00016790 [Ensete ventricosum]